MARGVQFPQVIYPRSHGKYSKLDMKPKSLIRRRKTYRDEEGVIVGYGAEEAYFVANPRDYETHPLREGEKRNTSIFHRSMTEALQELSDPVRKAEWSKRWHAQLNEPEPDRRWIVKQVSAISICAWIVMCRACYKDKCAVKPVCRGRRKDEWMSGWCYTYQTSNIKHNTLRVAHSIARRA